MKGSCDGGGDDGDGNDKSNGIKTRSRWDNDALTLACWRMVAVGGEGADDRKDTKTVTRTMTRSDRDAAVLLTAVMLGRVKKMEEEKQRKG